MSFISRLRGTHRARSSELKRRAELRTWSRPLGGAGLPAAEEARIMQLEAELRDTEARIRAGGN
jgi:hypothetical protein